MGLVGRRVHGARGLNSDIASFQEPSLFDALDELSNFLFFNTPVELIEASQ